MGLFLSKRSKKRTKITSADVQRRKDLLDKDSENVKRDLNDYTVPPTKSREMEEVLIKKIIRTQLNQDSHVFVLNQLLLGIQFFANYEVDIEKSKEFIRNEQNEKSKILRQHNKSVMLTNELSNAIDQSVIFKPRHGPRKEIKSNIYNHRMYIVHDNIDVINEPSLDNSTYSSMNFVPNYRVQMEKKYVKHIGYFHLKLCDYVPLAHTDSIEDVQSSEKNNSVTSSSITTSSNSLTGPEFGGPSSRLEDEGVYMNNASASTSSDYDYTYLAAFHEHQPLVSGASYNPDVAPLSTAILPDECITERMIMQSLSEEFPYKFEKVQYLNSKNFRNYFKRIFKETLSKNLEIDNQQLQNATQKGATIYCSIVKETFQNSYEIIPAISCPWPQEAVEWLSKQRELAESVIGSDRWLTIEMIHRIYDLNCHLIPMPQVTKRNRKSNNTSSALEWKVIFPDAERYLESKLSDCQLKVYILTKILYKTFVEENLYKPTSNIPNSNDNSRINFISDEHFRAHLFTHCQQNTIKWSDYNIGGNLLEFLRTFIERIKTKKLPDFFLPNRNLFEHIPDTVLSDLLKYIYRITENPIMYVMRALKNVRFVKNFYPRTNLKKLYKLLTIDNPLMLINRNMHSFQSPGNDAEGSDNEVDVEVVHEINQIRISDGDNGVDFSYALGNMGEYQKMHENDAQKRITLKNVQFHEKEKRYKLDQTNRRQSKESINIEMLIKNDMDDARKPLLYELFAKQFLDSCDKCLEFENHKWIHLLLRHVYLLIDLWEEHGYEIMTRDFKEKARQFEIKLRNPNLSERRLTKNMNVKKLALPNNKSPVRKSMAKPSPQFSPAKPISPISPMSFSEPSEVITEKRKKSVMLNGEITPTSILKTPLTIRKQLSSNFSDETRKKSILRNGPMSPKVVSPRSPAFPFSPPENRKKTVVVIEKGDESKIQTPNISTRPRLKSDDNKENESTKNDDHPMKVQFQEDDIDNLDIRL